MNLWHIFLTFYDKITPVNLCIHDTCHKDSIVQNLFTRSQKLIVFNFEKKKPNLYKYSVHTYILFLLHGTKSKLQEYEE